MNNLKKKITIICADEASGLETIAFRGVLEYLGYVVSTHWIGNKKDFLDLLQGKTPTDDILIISSHGDEGKFFMPTEECVLFDELNIHLPDKTVLSVGCETGEAQTQFMQGECRDYIAPQGSPEGNDAMLFTVKFFWLLDQGKSVKEAFDTTSKDMPKGSAFILSQNRLA